MATSKWINSNYTIKSTDKNIIIYVDSPNPVTIIVSAATLPLNNEIAVVRWNTGAVNFISDNTAIIRSELNELFIANQFGAVMLVKAKVTPKHEYLLSGSLKQ